MKARALLALFVTVALAGGAAAASFSIPAFTLTSGSLAPGFYVDCNGVDTNPGTIAQPVLTMTKAAALMAASGTIKTTYVRGKSVTNGVTCAYPVASNILAANQSWIGYPPDGRMAATINFSAYQTGSNRSNLTVANLKLVGTNASGLFEMDGNNINFQANAFVDTVQTPIHLYNVSNVLIQGNTFDTGTTVANDDIAITYNAAGTYTNVLTTDNTFVRCTRFCIEEQNQLPATLTINGVHVDRNACTNCMQIISGSFGFLSVVTGAGTGSTVIGNTTSRATGTACTHAAAMEVAMQNATISGNVLTNECTGWFVGGGSQGAAYLNNVMVYDMTTFHTGFSPDGGYDHTEWIGTNQYNVGFGLVGIPGCPANTSPSFCTLGFNAYGTQPTTYAASAVYVNPY